VRTAADFGPEYDGLWERARDSYTMSVRRDAAYLRWKYLLCPHRKYDLREARRGGQLVGFAVSREQDYRGLRLGWIVDLFSDTPDHGAKDALIADVLRSFGEKGVARAQAYTMNAPLAADLRRHGFFPGISAVQFCVRAGVDPQGAYEDLGGWN